MKSIFFHLSLLTALLGTVLAWPTGLQNVAALSNFTALQSTDGTTDAPEYSVLRRQCIEVNDKQFGCDMLMPTIEEMVARTRAGKGNAANSASFYTNLNDPAFQKNDFDAAWVVGWWKSRNDDKYYWVVNALSPRWFGAQKKWTEKNLKAFKELGVENPMETLSLCYFEALAVNVENPDVYLFTPRDKKWDLQSVWHRYELPALMQNEKVKRIWRVDPRPPEVKGIKEGDKDYCKHDERQLMYDRDDKKYDAWPFVYKQGWTCPYHDKPEEPEPKQHDPKDTPAPPKVK